MQDLIFYLDNTFHLKPFKKLSKSDASTTWEWQPIAASLQQEQNLDTNAGIFLWLSDRCPNKWTKDAIQIERKPEKKILLSIPWKELPCSISGPEYQIIYQSYWPWLTNMAFLISALFWTVLTTCSCIIAGRFRNRNWILFSDACIWLGKYGSLTSNSELGDL